jgi:hypothetical protein
MSLKFTKIATFIIAAAMLTSCSSKATKHPTAAAAPAAKTSTKDAKKATPKAEKKAETTQTGSLVCKHGADTRSIEVITKDGGCEVSYTKDGQSTTPAHSANGTAHCESVKEKIKGNLEGSGFKCE